MNAVFIFRPSKEVFDTIQRKLMYLTVLINEIPEDLVRAVISLYVDEETEVRLLSVVGRL